MEPVRVDRIGESTTDFAEGARLRTEARASLHVALIPQSTNSLHCESFTLSMDPLPRNAYGKLLKRAPREQLNV